MGLLSKTSKHKALPRELDEDELPNVMNADQPNTPKQRRFWPGKKQQSNSEVVPEAGSDPAAETDSQSTPAQKKRNLFGRKKDKQEAAPDSIATLERISSTTNGTNGPTKKGKAKKEKPPPPPPPRILTEAETAEAAESQRRAIDSIRNVHYNPESAIYNWEPAPVETGVSAAPNVNDGASSPANNTRAGKLKGMFRPGKKASTASRSTPVVSSGPQTVGADDDTDVVTNTATPDQSSKFGGVFRRKSKEKQSSDVTMDDAEIEPSIASPAESLTPARSKSVFGRFGKGRKSGPLQASPAHSIASEGVQMSNSSAFSSQPQYQLPEASPRDSDSQQDLNTREYAPVHANPLHSVGKDQLHTDRYDPAGLGANYTGGEPSTYR